MCNVLSQHRAKNSSNVSSNSSCLLHFGSFGRRNVNTQESTLVPHREVLATP